MLFGRHFGNKAVRNVVNLLLFTKKTSHSSKPDLEQTNAREIGLPRTWQQQRELERMWCGLKAAAAAHSHKQGAKRSCVVAPLSPDVFRI
jgi:hypothetical protein